MFVLIFLTVAALLFVGLNTPEKNNVEGDISVLVSDRGPVAGLPSILASAFHPFLAALSEGAHLFGNDQRAACGHAAFIRPC